MRLFAFCLSAALAVAAPAFAAFLHPADTDKDGKISKAEWSAFKFDPAQFAKADANHDGYVDGAEFMAWDAAGRGKPAG
ncbi:hypothetical protein [Phenylobacterium sp.]|uniref:hypothetical protein n=1 Tax=Phenylobacterium sp. TaxID=1871053 RepID=UPI002F413C75